MASNNHTKICKKCNQPVPTISGSHGKYCSLICRLWAKIEIGQQKECWEWKGAKDRLDYGRFSINRKMYGAHRTIYGICYGEIPYNLEVCHKCDNPSCCNPSHLFLATHADNMKDMVKKNRQAHNNPCFQEGEKHPRSSLTNTDVEIIKLKLKQGFSQTMLSQIFNVGIHTIHYIKTGRTWKHI